MIIWLASYPRSGNTLLRTVLQQTMGLNSVSDEVGEGQRIGMSEDALRITGFTEIDESWDDYYKRATQSSGVFLVKTHRPPRDNQPAIYVVRDGRSACASYARFHQRFTRPSYPSLLDIVLGCDFYGDWSSHYRTWIERDNTFLIRYEDLVNISDVMLKNIAQYVQYADRVVAWSNPFELLHERNPSFFRVGDPAWKEEPAWTDLIDSVFFHLHGDLMAELGYTPSEVLAEKKNIISNDMIELIQASKRILFEKRQLESICTARQVVIDGLKQVCDERLALIEELSKVRL